MAQLFSRRRFLGGAAGLMAASAAGGYAPMTAPTAGSATPPPLFVYVGCYTSKERKGKGEGISVYRMDPLSGSWTDVQLVKGIVNPSSSSSIARSAFSTPRTATASRPRPSPSTRPPDT